MGLTPMCAICGIVRPNRISDPDVRTLEQMRDAMTHRGPDDSGLYRDADAVLGARRLSIIDLSGGHQPLGNEDQTVWAVLNGEIYNYRELRTRLQKLGHTFKTQSDTETIVHLYEELEDAFVQELRGMFALALWDSKKRRLLLARDRMGIKPLYYTRQGDGIVFASEISGLSRHPDVSKELDPQSIQQYLLCEYVPAPGTIYRDIRKLPPGHILVAEHGRLWTAPYWKASIPGAAARKNRKKPQEQIAELERRMEESVRLHLESDVPVGICLSGGLDSTLILSCLRRISSQEIPAFTIGFEETSFDETAAASRIAKHFNARHITRTIRPKDVLESLDEVIDAMDEPLGDPSAVPTWHLSRLVKTEVKVALSGDGGDELFGGYPTYLAHRWANWYRRIPPFLRRRAIESGVARLPVSHENMSLDFRLRRFVRGENLPLAHRHFLWMGSFGPQEQSKLYSRMNPCRAMEDLLPEAVRAPRLPVNPDPATQAMWIDLMTYLPDDLLFKVDRMSMAHGVEIRVPFLDHPLVEFSLGLSGASKAAGAQTKILLRHLLQKQMPGNLAHLRKKGFGMPLASWLCGDFQHLLKEHLRPEKLRQGGFWNPDAIDQLLKEHASRARNHAKLIWTLLVFEMWRRRHA
ncbi:MAG: asparagine synthase (glutamine-hydrolyzing), partial [Candidatus Omnitrophica bacterium]|nr:asparagine synthase (glutamine-hydrolyzing) [Candidatus Omnitrophota bacterium]